MSSNDRKEKLKSDIAFLKQSLATAKLKCDVKRQRQLEEEIKALTDLLRNPTALNEDNNIQITGKNSNLGTSHLAGGFLKNTNDQDPEGSL